MVILSFATIYLNTKVSIGGERHERNPTIAPSSGSERSKSMTRPHPIWIAIKPLYNILGTCCMMYLLLYQFTHSVTMSEDESLWHVVSPLTLLISCHFLPSLDLLLFFIHRPTRPTSTLLSLALASILIRVHVHVYCGVISSDKRRHLTLPGHRAIHQHPRSTRSSAWMSVKNSKIWNVLFHRILIDNDCGSWWTV